MTQIWFGQGCAARASNPLPIFKGHFGRKWYPLLRIFLEKWAHFSQMLRFLGFSPFENPKTCGLSHKIGPMFKDCVCVCGGVWGGVCVCVCVKKRDPCLRISFKKAIH